MYHQVYSPVPADTWLITCVTGTLGHLLLAQANLVAAIPLFLMDVSTWVALVGLLGVIVRSWEARQAYSRALLERDAKIAELASKLSDAHDAHGRCEASIEAYHDLCRVGRCPLRDAEKDKAQG